MKLPDYPSLGQPAGRTAKVRDGFSLVELMAGMALFTILSVSLIALTFSVRAASEEEVYENTALTLGQAYLEQIRSMDYQSLTAAAGGGSLSLTASDGSTLNDMSGGTLTSGEWASETVMLDEDENGTPKQPMTFRLRVELNNLTTVTSGAADGIEIILHYATTYNYGISRTHRGSLRTVRSSIPTY